MLAGFERNLEQALRLAASQAPITVLARQPWLDKVTFSEKERSTFWNYSRGAAFYGRATGYYSDAAISRTLRAIDDVALRVADRCGVPSIDLQSLIGTDSGLFYDRNHFRPAASVPIAEAVTEVLLGAAENES